MAGETDVGEDNNDNDAVSVNASGSITFGVQFVMWMSLAVGVALCCRSNDTTKCKLVERSNPNSNIFAALFGLS